MLATRVERSWERWQSRRWCGGGWRSDESGHGARRPIANAQDVITLSGEGGFKLLSLFLFDGLGFFTSATTSSEYHQGYWGPITASTEWCEKNYEVTPYVAEFYNTISNAPGIILALIGLYYSISQRFERRFSVLHLLTIANGFGSILFHATLKHAQQQSDETPMVWMMLLYIYVLYSPDWHYRSTMPTVLFLYGTIFAILHSQFRFVVGFQLQLVFLAFLCLPRMYKYYIHTTEPRVRKLAHRYILFLVVGGIFWLADRHFCNQVSKPPINIQGHALWHVLMGFNSYFGNTFLQYCRAEQLNWNPRVEYLLGVLPYVKVQKTDTERKEQ